jgi:S-adenosylmethionine hydrolase
VAPAIFFLSDFGLRDELVGVVHSVLHRLAPGVPVIDLAHQLPPFDVRAAAGALERAAPHLGAGVVLALVDPGAATTRRALAIGVAPGGHGPSWLVGPDNGVLLPVLGALGGASVAYELEGSGSGSGSGSGPATPGSIAAWRDLFTPAAARLARGAGPEGIGIEIDRSGLVALAPVRTDTVVGSTVVTSVAHVDVFGNVQLRARADLLAILAAADHMEVSVGDPEAQAVRTPARTVGSFAELGPGELGILIDDTDHLSMVMDRASAADFLDLVRFGPAPTVRLARRL